MTEIPIPIPNMQIDRWDKHAYGSWGEFSTAGGSVLYLSAHVNFHGDRANGGSALVECIAPVREILDTTKLSFAELLQRDLEDHRVLSGLIPYLLDENHESIGFFPPLLAVLLPFDSDAPSSFSNSTESFNQRENGHRSKDLISPEYFRFGRTAYPEGNDVVRSQRTAELEWNSDKAKLVVIDGQHRAMALLAIYRSLSTGDKWTGSGAKYKHFYHEEIQRKWGAKGLPNLEVPITICVFPELLGPGKGEEVHRAARKLFVDVNKEAKTPNQSRLILLSESNLSDIFTRSWLDELRRINQSELPHNALPLCAIEFDTPSSHRTDGKDKRPQRKICIATVQQLKVVIEQMMRGSEEWIVNVKKTNSRVMGGSDAFMQRQLGLDEDNETELVINGVPIMELSELRRETFPPEAVDPLRERFLSRWGIPLIRILSELEPYNTVARSIREFERSWAVVADQEMALAKEALFEGVGTYWTLEEFHLDWKENHPKNRPAAAAAWEIVEKKADEYEIVRSEYLSGKSKPNEAELQAAKSLADRLTTQAVLSGIGMTFATLVKDFQIPADKREIFAEQFVIRLNQFFNSSSPTGRDRKFYLSSRQPDGNNQRSFYSFVKNLEPKAWVHVRWLLIEAFFSSPFEWSKELLAFMPLNQLESLKKVRVSEVREIMIETIVQENISTELARDASDSDKDLVRFQVQKAMEDRYLDWFEEVVTFSLGSEQSEDVIAATSALDDEEDAEDAEDAE